MSEIEKTPIEGGEPATSNSPEELIKNVKSEFSRKHEKTNQMLEQLAQTQVQLQEALAKLAQPKQPAQQSKSQDDDNIEDLMYSDPKRYTEIVKERAKQEALELMRQETSSQATITQTISQLASEYPELADENSDLTKEAREILKGVSDAERHNPRTYEYAVMKAAAKMDVKPKSKRPASQDEGFVAPSYSSPQNRSKKRSTEAVINENKDIARQFGVNLDDPKQKEQYLSLLKQKGRI